MTEETHPIVNLTHDDLAAMLRRALRITLIVGVIASIIVLIGSGWRNGAMLFTGAAHLRRQHPRVAALIRVINARMDQNRDSRQRWHRGPLLCAQAHHFCRGHLC